MNEVLRELEAVRQTTLSMWRWAMRKRRIAAADQPEWPWGRGFYDGMVQAYDATLMELRHFRRRIGLSVWEEDQQAEAADEVAAAEARMENR